MTSRLTAPLARARNSSTFAGRLAAVAAASSILVACSSSGPGSPTADNSSVMPVNAFNTLKGTTKDFSMTFTEGTNMASTPSPDGQRIAFTAMGALWSIPIEGGTAARLTGWDMEPTAPVWSPDGKRIAFQNYDAEGNYHLWTIAPNGTDLKRITTGAFDDREPSWRPDGTGLVFASDRSNDGQYKIWTVMLDGGGLRPLTQGPGAESNPAMSPDGKQLAFVDNSTTGKPRIFIATLQGSEAPKLQADGTMPAWRPDGSGLTQQLPGNRSLSVLGKQVANGEDLFPFPVRYLKDGRFLYTSDGKMRLRGADGGTLVDVAFNATLQVRRPVFTKRKDHRFDLLGPQPVRGISAPVISPDGQSIAFGALNDIWVMRIGQTPVRMTKDTARDGTPQFTPDGKAIYFATEKDNGGALAIDRIDLVSKKRTRIAATTAKSMVTPKMSPAGDRIAYTSDSGQLEIWDLKSRKAQKIIDQVSRQVSTPQWFPDGQKIMLVDNQPINNRFREGYNKLRVIDLASKTGTFYPVAQAPQQISDRDEGSAVLAPDGSKVAFIMDSVLHVMQLKPDGSPAGAAKAITTEAADLPSWAGDSSTILYKAGEQLKTIHADGTGAKAIPVDLTWQQATAKGTTVVWAGKLWNGLTQSLQTNVDIVIEGNRITAIQPHSNATLKKASKVVDASKLTVMPGLWDPHFHPLTLYQGGQYGQVSAAMFSYGITDVQSVAGPLHQSVEMREALAAGNLLGPRLFVSPPLWEGNRLFYDFARTLRTPEVADLEIAKAKEMGADFLKSYVRAPIPIMTKIAQAGLDMGVATGTHMLAPGAAAGLAETTHLSATQRMGYGWAKSAYGGVSYQDAYDLHAKTDFHLVDTLFSSLPLVGDDPALVHDDRFKYLTTPNFYESTRTQAKPTPAQRAAMLLDAQQSAKIQRAGGLLAIGTDTPLVAPGIALHTNLRAAALASSNFQALQDVTINAAKASLVERDLGSVEVGKIADLSIVRGDPLADVKAAANTQYVVKNGVSYTLADILAPFKTKPVVAMREKTLRAYADACEADAHACSNAVHGH